MSEVREQVGKIRLSAIVAEWSDTQTFNPRILAGEVAGVLRGGLSQSVPSVLHESVASAILYDPIAGAGGVTIDALADYFEAVSQGVRPETITTSTGQVRAAVVFIARYWIDKAVSEATQRAEAVAGYVSVANDVAGFAVMASGAPARIESPAPQTSGSALGYLQIRQAQQRQAGEKSAAEQLDAAQLKAQRLENELAVATAERDTWHGRFDLAVLELESMGDELSAERRARAESDAKSSEMSEVIRATNALLTRLNKTPKQHLHQPTAPHWLAIAGLLQLLLDRARPHYTQGTASEAIEAKGWRGASASQLTKLFAEAKKAASEAQARAETRILPSVKPVKH